MGINAFPAEEYTITDSTQSIKEGFEEGKKVKIAGRLISRRIQGKASFAELQDSSGRIQVYFNRDEICPTDDKELYNEVYKHLLDIGDIIGVKGELFKTQVGEMTVMVKNFTLLTKTLRPLPFAKIDENGVVHDAFNDPELRYRQRYVDLVVNPEVKDVFVKRTKLFNAMRQFFNDAGYFEVETPILQSIPGGAAARLSVGELYASRAPLGAGLNDARGGRSGVRTHHCGVRGEGNHLSASWADRSRVAARHFRGGRTAPAVLCAALPLPLGGDALYGDRVSKACPYEQRYEP